MEEKREIYELSPTNGRKSFYGKAQVILEKNGDRTLFSYGTAIMTIKKVGEKIRHYDGWTATTGKHIISFSGECKKAFLAIPYEKYNH
jgi:hypothetical protein